MLVAHLVPGYFVAAKTQLRQGTAWSPTQRVLVWAVALGSTVVPDLDVIYNVLFRGFFNHSTLWTHSIFVYLGFGLLWFTFHKSKRLVYCGTLMGLIAVGGLSHLVLDIIAHGTPILYPVSVMVFGIAPQRVIDGGLWAYLTDPIFLLEPLVLGIAVLYWVRNRRSLSASTQKRLCTVIVGGILAFTVTFIVFLPTLQRAVLPLLPV